MKHTSTHPTWSCQGDHKGSFIVLQNQLEKQPSQIILSMVYNYQNKEAGRGIITSNVPSNCTLWILSLFERMNKLKGGGKMHARCPLNIKAFIISCSKINYLKPCIISKLFTNIIQQSHKESNGQGLSTGQKLKEWSHPQWEPNLRLQRW